MGEQFPRLPWLSLVSLPSWLTGRWGHSGDQQFPALPAGRRRAPLQGGCTSSLANIWMSKLFWGARQCLDSGEGFPFAFGLWAFFGGLAFVSKKCMQLGTSVRWRVASIRIYISSFILGWWRRWWCNIDVFAAAWRAIVGAGVLGHHVNVRNGGMSLVSFCVSRCESSSSEKRSCRRKWGSRTVNRLKFFLVRMSAAKQCHVWLLDNLFALADFRSWLCLARQVELGQGHVPELISDFHSQHAALLTLSGGLCAVRAKEALQASWVTGSYQTVGRCLELEGLWEESHPLLVWGLLWMCHIVATIKSSMAKNRGQNCGWCARYICLQVAMATKYHSGPGQNSFFSAVQSAKLNTFGCHSSGAVRKHLYATRRLRCWKQTWNENLQTWSTTTWSGRISSTEKEWYSQRTNWHNRWFGGVKVRLRVLLCYWVCMPGCMPFY